MEVIIGILVFTNIVSMLITYMARKRAKWIEKTATDIVLSNQRWDDWMREMREHGYGNQGRGN